MGCIYSKRSMSSCQLQLSFRSSCRVERRNSKNKKQISVEATTHPIGSVLEIARLGDRALLEYLGRRKKKKQTPKPTQSND